MPHSGAGHSIDIDRDDGEPLVEREDGRRSMGDRGVEDDDVGQAEGSRRPEKRPPQWCVHVDLDRFERRAECAGSVVQALESGWADEALGEGDGV